MMISNKLYGLRGSRQIYCFLRNLCDEPPTKDNDKKLSKEDSSNEDLPAKKLQNLLSSFKISENQPYKNSFSVPSMRKTIESKKEKLKEDKTLYTSLDPKLRDAVKNITKLFPGEDPLKTEKELIESVKKRVSDIKDTLLHIKIDSSENYSEDIISSFGQRSSFKNKSKTMMSLKSVPLFSETPLGLFPDKETLKSFTEKDSLDTWKHLHDAEVKAAATQYPRNQIEEMINWTEQGKLWQFPIDNEIGLEEEKKSSFADHIFLERHLVGWCPKQGPIRHFMELVCNGLSKNPYISVKRKKEHIEWYANYFEGKKDVLKNIGAL